jgi:hypothetical protein
MNADDLRHEVNYSWVSDNPLFKSLTLQEENEFREYARKNDPPYSPSSQSWEVFHPVCREEWLKRGLTPNFVGGDI